MDKTKTEVPIRMMYKGVGVDDRTKDYIDKKLDRITKLLERISEIEVEIDLDKKGKFRVEIMVKTPYSLYRAEETTESIEGSTDTALDEIYQQIVREKDKIKDLRERGGRSLKKKMVIDENARFRN
ncbi:MAG: ribosome-associated translation inhibitor RaiA [Candidatus Moranbacteria bacterium]|nr:ribosome-associated translation inhibitor RaiA [Candidatus Moranbacteria bacterium]